MNCPINGKVIFSVQDTFTVQRESRQHREVDRRIIGKEPGLYMYTKVTHGKTNQAFIVSASSLSVCVQEAVCRLILMLVNFEKHN